MEAVRDLWTDERLDDLNHRVDEGFRGVNREFQAVRLEMRTEFAAVRSEMRTEFTAARSEIAAFQRMFLQLFCGLMVTLLLGFAGLIATILTQT